MRRRRSAAIHVGAGRLERTFFYNRTAKQYKRWSDRGACCGEMEAAILFHDRRAPQGAGTAVC